MLYSFVVLSWQFKPLVALSYVVASLITFMMYAFDKSAAIKGQWRTPESTLHLLSLACGWPGALLAQQLLRHKTTKPGFIVNFWFTVVCNVTAFTLLHSPIVNFVKI
ncbi:MAG: DUF1294 domain-containing protein [Rugosibacter sp.]|nr:DUF1294 domain-containing protein [Rugosibacter sp.]